MSYLKKGHAVIESLGGENVALVELNAMAQKEMLESHTNGDMFTATAVVVKYGTEKWREKTPVEIMEELPLLAIQEIAEKVTILSGLDDSKNSDSILGESSSSH